MRVLVAFDKFKDSMTAAEACARAQDAILAVHDDWQVDMAPITDGGEGFCEILTEGRGGRFQEVAVSGPRGEATTTRLGIVEASVLDEELLRFLALDPLTADATLGIVEMAAASGLQMLPKAQRDPWKTSTVGTGQLIDVAYNAGCQAAIAGIGGSATNDLGTGALSALGIRFLDTKGNRIEWPAPETWGRVASIEGTSSDDLPLLRIACDVNNPLLGERGATAVYGPQKGLAPEDFDQLEEACANMAEQLTTHFDRSSSLWDEPGSGAAGGIGFGLRCARKNAEYISGFELVERWLDLETKIAAADLVITGEGRFDRSSLEGKGPAAILSRARNKRKAIKIFAGVIAEDARSELLNTFGSEVAHAISPADLPLERALAEGPERLAAKVREVLA